MFSVSSNHFPSSCTNLNIYVLLHPNIEESFLKYKQLPPPHRQRFSDLLHSTHDKRLSAPCTSIPSTTMWSREARWDYTDRLRLYLRKSMYLIVPAGCVKGSAKSSSNEAKKIVQHTW